MNKYDSFIRDMSTSQAMASAIKEIYQTEFSEQFETILLKKEADFMRHLSLRAKYQIEERYSSESFENMKLLLCIKECEKEIYETDYKSALNALKSHLNDSEVAPSQLIVFRKHCKYQDNALTHSCEQESTMIVVYNELKAGRIDYLICKKCLKAYQPFFVKLYCNFSYMSYYSLIEKEQTERRYDIQPVTWEKYHCDLLINEQMRCLKCQANLYWHIIKNEVMCFGCGFTSDPQSMIWKCVECFKPFTSNAKIFNPNEYKAMTLAIKDSMVNKKYALPPSFLCGHSCEFFRHKKDCNGVLYMSNLSERLMVMCSKCHELIKYDKYIWTCPVCPARFRNDTKVTAKEPNQIIKKVQFSLQSNKVISSKNASKKALNRSHNNLKSLVNAEAEDKKEDVTSNDNESKEDFDFFKLYPKSIEEKRSDCDSVQLPLFDLSSYEVVSQISTSDKSSVFAVKSPFQKAYMALKRNSYSNEAEMNAIMQQYALHYSFQLNKNIVAIKGLNVDDSKQEISVLEELGIGDWESEIASMAKMKQHYTEKELLSILSQLTNALEYLQQNDYCHCYVYPNKVITFKGNVYKMTDLSYLKETASLDIVQNDNPFVSPNLNNVFKEKKVTNVDLIKSDVYSLALCVIAAVTHDTPYQLFNDFVNIDIKEDSNSTMKRFESLLKSKIDMKLYSPNFISLIQKMLDVNERSRVDFIELKDLLNGFDSPMKAK